MVLHFQKRPTFRKCPEEKADGVGLPVLPLILGKGGVGRIFHVPDGFLFTFI